MKGLKEFYEEWARPMIAEYFGQLIFTFLHCSAGFNNKDVGSALAPAINDGLVVTILVITIGHISGAHVNFAVTTAVGLGGGIRWQKVPLYLVAQMLGSLSGAGLSYVTTGESAGAFSLGDGVTVGRGVLTELILTSLLTLAVLLAAVELDTNNAAFAIGFAILIDILAGFHVTGGCMNPTLSFGPAVVAGQWMNYWVYWVGPLLGAFVSGLLYRLFLGGNARWLFREVAPSNSTKSNV
ncbi:unnamed protein product [Clavelina lepadiformis]|uniref:Uncharacterized protein n=1 Tax=Clavelina lepadiformis TaxID=159417 RepID=A0ABP0G981_CLALP